MPIWGRILTGPEHCTAFAGDSRLRWRALTAVPSAVLRAVLKACRSAPVERDTRPFGALVAAWSARGAKDFGGYQHSVRCGVQTRLRERLEGDHLRGLHGEPGQSAAMPGTLAVAFRVVMVVRMVPCRDGIERCRARSVTNRKHRATPTFGLAS